MPMRKTQERPIVFAWPGRYSGLVKIVAGTNHVPAHFGIINALIAMRHRFLLAASFLYLVAADLIWIARDTRPPFWDMAEHESAALRIYEAFTGQGLRGIADLSQVTAPYPPFYQSVVAGFYAVFGRSVDSAQSANLLAIGILLLATYGLGRTVLEPLPAAAAAVMVNFYPYMLWLSRETLIDYWLTSMVALAMWSLMRTNDFLDRKRSIIFGIVCGLGMLTKWTFALFLVLPTLWAARKNVKNAAIAAGTAAVLASYWYMHALGSLAQLLRINSAGAVNEGDPARLSFQAIVFYVRVLEGYQLFLVLLLAFIAGAILLARNFEWEWMPIVLWIAGGWLGLMLFQNKDPRYSAPLLPAVALITAQIFQRRKILVTVLMPFLLFQHYLVSFGIPQLPPAVVLAKGPDGTITYNWNFYTQRYFDLWGPPAREDWQIRHVLDKVSSPNGRPVRLGMVPDIPRFDIFAFQFYIALWKFPVTVNRIVTFDESAIANNDYILVSEKDKGFEPGSFFTADLPNINQYILGRPESFRIVEWFPLPNGDVIRLYKVGGS
ncbi:MAG TPA: glycosyltransferase family 39 protein [Terriglobia bacterium]|nr:glycosyltransferase family 39 protein [Terriglobia bacterium]